MLPAYAGMILCRPSRLSGRARAPRVCGDDPGMTAFMVLWRDVLPAYAGMIRSFR